MGGKSLISKKQNKLCVGLILCFLIAVLSFLYLKNLRLHFTWDSFQYLEFGLKDFIETGPDEMRLFGYGTIYKLLQKVFLNPAGALKAMVMVQWCFWGVGGICLWRGINILSNNKNCMVSVVLSVLYALSPSVLAWNVAILTESITLSLACIYILSMASYLKKATISKETWLLVLCLGMIALRPSSALFLIITAGCMSIKLLVAIKQKKRIIVELIGFGGAILASALVLLYAFAFQHKYQNFSLSNTLLRQKLFIDIERGYYQNIDFPYTEKIDQLKDAGEEIWEIMYTIKEELGNAQSSKFHKACIQNNKSKMIKDTWDLYKRQSGDYFEPRYTVYHDDTYYGIIQAEYRWNYDGTIFSPPGIISQSYFVFANKFLRIFNLGTSGIIAICELGYVLFWNIKKKVFLWAEAGMSIFVIGTLILTFTGQCAEWGRTAVAVLPFLYCLVGLNLNAFLSRKEG